MQFYEKFPLPNPCGADFPISLKILLAYFGTGKLEP